MTAKKTTYRTPMKASRVKDLDQRLQEMGNAAVYPDCRTLDECVELLLRWYAGIGWRHPGVEPTIPEWAEKGFDNELWREQCDSGIGKTLYDAVGALSADDRRYMLLGLYRETRGDWAMIWPHLRDRVRWLDRSWELLWDMRRVVCAAIDARLR